MLLSLFTDSALHPPATCSPHKQHCHSCLLHVCTPPLPLQVTVLWCKECGRYLQPPKHWMRAELESKELLTFCIKKVGNTSAALSVVFSVLALPPLAPVTINQQ